MEKFEAYIERNCGKHKYNLIIDVIGKYPDLYRPDLLRIKEPLGLDKKAKKSWELVVAILKDRYPKLAEHIIWIIWRWVRTTYHNKQCPPFIAGKIPYLDAIKDEITNRPLARVYQSLIDGTKQAKPKRIRSRVAYMNQVVTKPFVWTAMDYFLSHHGVNPCVVMIEVISMHPPFYKHDLENELVPCQLLGSMEAAWNKIHSVLVRSYPQIPEMTFYHAWRTLRRNFDHEMCPPEWAERLFFVRKDGKNEVEYEMPGPSGFRPLKKIMSIQDANSAIREMDEMDARMNRRKAQAAAQAAAQKAAAAVASTSTSATPNWLSWFGPEKQSALMSSAAAVENNGEESDYDADPYQCTDDAVKYEDDPPYQTTEPKRKRVANFQMPETYYQNLVPKPQKLVFPVKERTTVPIVVSTLNERKRRKEAEDEEREIDEHVNAEIQDLLKQMEKDNQEITVSSSGIKLEDADAGQEEMEEVVCLSDDGEIKQEEEPEPAKKSDAFKAMLMEKWMEFAAMEDSKTHISKYKKAIMTVVNDAYGEM